MTRGLAPLRPLSPREAEAVEWMAQGLTNDEIAVAMGITLNTVKRHLEHASWKAGFPELNRVLLAIWWTKLVDVQDR